MQGLDKHFEFLGFLVEDKVSGFKGIVDSISFDLYGCVQADVRPQAVTDKDGKQSIETGRWLDIKRLKKIAQEPVMPIPLTYAVPAQPSYVNEIGAADKPQRS